MLTEYKGSANSSDIFPFLVGERIEGVLSDSGELVLILSSGASLVLTASRGESPATTPAMWSENKQDTQKRINKRRTWIQKQVDSLGNLKSLESVLMKAGQ